MVEPALTTTIITSLPNLAIAIWCIYRQQKTIDTLLQHQQQLVDQLMRLCADAKSPPS